MGNVSREEGNLVCDFVSYDKAVAEIAGECRMGDEDAIRHRIWDYLDDNPQRVLAVLRCCDVDCLQEVYERDGWGQTVRVVATETMLAETIKVQEDAFYEADALINEALDRDAQG